jgi:hypothetical protein
MVIKGSVVNAINGHIQLLVVNFSMTKQYVVVDIRVLTTTYIVTTTTFFIVNMITNIYHETLLATL